MVLKKKRAPDTIKKKKMVPCLKTQELIVQRSELIFSAKLTNNRKEKNPRVI